MAADNNELIGKMYFKQEQISEDILEIKVTLAAQHESLKAHMERTRLNEENLALLRKEFKPVSKHVDMMNGIAKFITLVGVIATITKVLMTFIH